MSTPASHAARLRGGLVGACSALTATVAHTAAGGMAPAGSPLIVLLLLCAALGAAVGGLNLQTRSARTWWLIAGLGAGQLLGHFALAMSGGHHHHAEALLTAPMAGMHAAAAIGLGVLIGVAEYLFVVCASVLTWLRIFATARIRPLIHEPRRPSNVVVARPVLLRTGLGMRAPPAVPGMGF
ncbi:hypothetical protein ACNQR7_08725 [Mycolicibacterium senegalense]|uniref:Uncharacterized protein n=2 Tax=Mycolicibacterium TaxID=1866885 RepID=A0ABR5FYA2_9MYCO|nr:MULTISPECIES: hypothetical protein [Mycolicibacterium]KLI08996.1 hypothetical protein AA982_05865 [Mycolicibacterium senegalense]KLO52928.1 hypothetical protein ABW05_16890 [Mycolicibacterium senegalense]OBJ99801.1 hypothetical protein A5639_28185 [Mycolicibacterium conceptionense]OMB76908.1 hypothetical protein A5741_31330 [Mycolicibacterium conceptionense]OMC02276.1 hypothetical protein A5746_09710 [Mycolicibacterium conceptionense]